MAMSRVIHGDHWCVLERVDRGDDGGRRSGRVHGRRILARQRKGGREVCKRVEQLDHDLARCWAVCENGVEASDGLVRKQGLLRELLGKRHGCKGRETQQHLTTKLGHIRAFGVAVAAQAAEDVRVDIHRRGHQLLHEAGSLQEHGPECAQARRLKQAIDEMCLHNNNFLNKK